MSVAVAVVGWTLLMINDRSERNFLTSGKVQQMFLTVIFTATETREKL